MERVGRRVLQVNFEDPYGYYGEELGVEELVEAALRARADTLVVFARDGWGRVFYGGSRLYPRHSTVRLDVGKLVERARENGVRVVVMALHTANRYLYRLHPDWAQRTREGEPVVLEHYPSDERVSDPHWPLICPNSPGFKEYFLEEAVEALEKTGAAGLLLDSFRYSPDWDKACYCRYCQEAFRREHGMELPESPEADNTSYRLAWEWRYRVVVGSLEAIRQRLESSGPRGRPLLYNSHPGGWAGRGNRVLEEARKLVDGVFAEASETDYKGPGFLTFITKLNLGIMGYVKPVYVSRNLFYGLRTTQPATPEQVGESLWEIVASGGLPWATVFSSLLSEEPGIVDVVGKFFEALDPVLEALEGAEPIRTIGLVYSNLTHDWYLHRNPEYYVGEVIGFSLMLSHLHLPWTIVPDWALEEPRELSRHQLLILANTGVMSERAEEAVRRAHGEGTRLLATHEVGRMRPDLTYREALALQDLLGARYEGVLKWGYIYVDTRRGEPRLWSGLPPSILLGDTSILFRKHRADPLLGEPVRTTPLRGARTLAYYRMPRSAYGYEYTLGRSPPAPGGALDLPAIVEGRGSLYYTFRLGLHYDRLGHPHYLELLRRPLVTMVEPPYRIEAPPTVQAEGYRRGEGMVIVLVNHTSNQRFLDAPMVASGSGIIGGFDPYYSVSPSKTHIPVGGVRIGIRAEGDTLIRSITGGWEKRLTPNTGWAWASLPPLELGEALEVVPAS